MVEDTSEVSKHFRDDLEWPNSGKIDRNASDNERRQQVNSKRDAYSVRFGENYQPEPDYLLSENLCLLEMERARSLLSERGEVKSYENSGHIFDFEIMVDGRRFTIPRDEYLKHNGAYINVSVWPEVVSVLDEYSWPSWLRVQLIDSAEGYVPSADASDSSFEINPKTKIALKHLSSEYITEDIRKVAIYFGLGDNVPKYKVDSRSTLSLEKTVERFGVESEAELKRILQAIGLKVSLISNRLSDKNDPEGLDANSRTEIDALLEAINLESAKTSS